MKEIARGIADTILYYAKLEVEKHPETNLNRVIHSLKLEITNCLMEEMKYIKVDKGMC